MEHAVQAAACARAAGVSDEVVAGALLHDIGHLIGLASPGVYGRMGDCGVMAHEGIGAAYLERLGFPAVTCSIVRRHVDAKRYLTSVDPTYYARLSEASKTTLGYQGGPMTEEEAKEFEVDPLKETILAMRRWDEAAKVPGLDVPSLASYAPMLLALVTTTTTSSGGGDGDAAAAAAAGK